MRDMLFLCPIFDRVPCSNALLPFNFSACTSFRHLHVNNFEKQGTKKSSSKGKGVRQATAGQTYEYARETLKFFLKIVVGGEGRMAVAKSSVFAFAHVTGHSLHQDNTRRLMSARRRQRSALIGSTYS
jgi:hypothetical protein